MKRDLLQFLFVAVPKALAGICTLAINLVLLRFFGPEQYGVYALCLSAIVICDAVLGSAIDLGVIRLASVHRDDDPKRCLAVQATGVYLKIIFVAVASCALSLAAKPISRAFFHSADQQGLVYLSCAAVLTLLLLRSAQIHPQIQGRFLQYGLLELLQMTLKYGGIAILLLSVKARPGVVLGAFTGGPIAAITIFLLAWRRELFPLPAFHPGLARELLGFVKWFFLTFTVSNLVGRVDIFLLATWSDLRQVGLLSAAQTLAYVPQLLGTYLSILLSPRVMPYWRDGKFLHFFRRFQLAMMAACVLLYLGGVLVLRLAGHWILPPSFLASQQVVLILLPGALAGLLTFPLTITFLLFIRPRFLIVMDCVALPFMIVLYSFAIHRYGAVGAAWVTSSSFVIKATIAQVEAWRLARTRQREDAPAAIPIEPAQALTTWASEVEL